MPVGFTADPAGLSEQLVLRWCQSPEAFFREENVRVIRSAHAEATIRCSSQIAVDLRVNLISKNCEREGVVRSCLKEGSTFVVSILMDSDEDLYRPAMLHEFDPGALLVDDFLSEEDEAKILDELEGELKLSQAGQPAEDDYGMFSTLGQPTYPNCTLQYLWTDGEHGSRFCTHPKSGCTASPLPSGRASIGFSHLFNTLVSCTRFSGSDHFETRCVPTRSRYSRPESRTFHVC